MAGDADVDDEHDDYGGGVEEDIDARLVEESCEGQDGLGTLGLDTQISSSPTAAEAQISCRP